jgi:hypothetical protein
VLLEITLHQSARSDTDYRQQDVHQKQGHVVTSVTNTHLLDSTVNRKFAQFQRNAQEAVWKLPRKVDSRPAALRSVPVLPSAEVSADGKALLRHGRHLCGLVSQHGPKHAQPLTLARDLALQRLHAQQQPPSTSLHVLLGYVDFVIELLQCVAGKRSIS